MKNIIIILTTILFTNVALCQVNPNIISKEEFNSIKINSVTINDIRATEGLENKVTNLNLGTIKDKRMNDGSRGRLVTGTNLMVLNFPFLPMLTVLNILVLGCLK